MDERKAFRSYRTVHVLGVLFVLAGGMALSVLPAFSANVSSQSEAAKKLRKYSSRYYTIYTDMDMDAVREIRVRMTTTAQEYARRTKSFGGVIRRKLPFYIFSKQEDYIAAGGVPGSVGLYTGKSLMALAGKQTGERLWNTVQHEAWHQFVHMVIRGKIPIWVNEGLAEYFGHGQWTGDGFVIGVIPPQRLKQVKDFIKKDKMLPFLDMLKMDSQQWTSNLTSRNYDQAWSMCHFLVHAENDKYRKRFSAFIRDISRARPWEKAFLTRFGRNVKGFRKRYEQWWSALPENPTANLYTKITVQTLTSYLARARRLKLEFDDDVEKFFAAAKEGKIRIYPKTYPSLWLPESLLKKALKEAEKLSTWSLVTKQGAQMLLLTGPDGTVFKGKYTLQSKRPPRVTVTITTPPKG